MSLALVLLLAVGPQDTLRLAAGVHEGPLVLTRPTVVIGALGAVIRGSGTGSVVEVRAAHSQIRGVRIEHSGRNADGYDAGVAVRADSVLLEDLVIRDILFGVHVENARGVTLRRLDIAGPAGLPESERGDGITFYSSRGAVAEGNRIAQVRDGIYFSYADSVVVRDNVVTRVRFGVHYMFSHHNRFERNTFTDNAAGAVIMFSRGLVVTDNVFAWNAGSRSYGLVLQSASDATVRGNLLVGNGIGVFFDNAIRVAFTDNVVSGNWLGLRLFDNSERVQVTGNAIGDNTFDASGGGVAGSYELCVAGRGNYWGAAAARGYDLDGDGALDVPHAAGAPLAEVAMQRAALRLFLDTPAAGVIDWAERTFPVFDVAGVVDACPLARPPEPPMLARLPAAPAGTGTGPGSQQAAGALALAAGVGLLWVAHRRRP